MKYCKTCNTQNKDENNFCNACGCPEFTPTPEAVLPPQSSVQPAPAIPNYRAKPEFTVYDLLTIFGFVASIIGSTVIALILEPLALFSTIVGFAKGKRYRGLAMAGVVIAAIALLVHLFLTLHENGIIPEWVINGAFET